MYKCILLLSLFCQPTKPATVAAGATIAAAFTDTWSTVRLFDQCKVSERVCREADPLQRPFMTHGKPWAYTSTYGQVLVINLVSNRLLRSRNRVARVAGWMMQVAHIESRAVGITGNLALTRSYKRFQPLDLSHFGVH